MENILMAKVLDAGKAKHIVRVADFGLVLPRNSSRARVGSTDGTMPSEVVLGSFAESSDVCSFGHIMLRTFSPRTCQILAAGAERGYVAQWLVSEWRSNEPWVTPEHCKEAAKWICKSVDKQTSFATIQPALVSLREKVEGCRDPSCLLASTE
eukprot:2680428-Amphidinium_carterae.1